MLIRIYFIGKLSPAKGHQVWSHGLSKAKMSELSALEVKVIKCAQQHQIPLFPQHTHSNIYSQSIPHKLCLTVGSKQSGHKQSCQWLPSTIIDNKRICKKVNQIQLVKFQQAKQVIVTYLHGKPYCCTISRDIKEWVALLLITPTIESDYFDL